MRAWSASRRRSPGPSEVVVIADDTTPVESAAIDVIVQAEHGPHGLAWLITWSEEAAASISAAIDRLVERAPRRDDIEATLAEGGYAVLVDGPEQALAVANAIAPEHLELMCADPEALVPLVRHAGAVFCGPWAPASVGDYIAGPSHVLPTFGSARFGQALTVADFTRHGARGDPRRSGARQGRAARCRARRSRRSRRSRRVGAHPHRGVAAMNRPRVRDDLRALEGYHSPQVEVEVRLNTNESPDPPPTAWRDAFAAELSRVDWHRYPDRGATALRNAIAELHGVASDQVFAANGSNEVLQTLLLTYGGPGRTALTFEPTYQLHSHISRLTATTVVEAERTSDFEIDLTDAKRVIGDVRPAITFLCSPNNPTGMVEPEATVRSVAVLGAGSRRRRRGLRAVRAVVGSGARRRGRAPRRHAHVLEDMVDGRGPPRVPRGPVVARHGARQGRPAVPPRHREADRGSARAHVRGRDGGPDRSRRVRARAGRLRPVRLSGRRSGRRVRTSCCSGSTMSGDDIWKGLLDHSVLVRNCASWPRLDDCLRVTVGTPVENDRFLRALAEVVR